MCKHAQNFFSVERKQKNQKQTKNTKKKMSSRSTRSKSRKQIDSPAAAAAAADDGCRKQSTAKYTNRPSPPFPANECHGRVKVGNSGDLFESVANSRGIYQWRKKKIQDEDEDDEKDVPRSRSPSPPARSNARSRSPSPVTAAAVVKERKMSFGSVRRQSSGPEDDAIPESGLEHPWTQVTTRKQMQVRYAGAVLTIRAGQSIYLDRDDRVVVGWHGSIQPPSDMEGHSIVRNEEEDDDVPVRLSSNARSRSRSPPLSKPAPTNKELMKRVTQLFDSQELARVVAIQERFKSAQEAHSIATADLLEPDQVSASIRKAHPYPWKGPGGMFDRKLKKWVMHPAPRNPFESLEEDEEL